MGGVTLPEAATEGTVHPPAAACEAATLSALTLHNNHPRPLQHPDGLYEAELDGAAAGEECYYLRQASAALPAG